jgi:peroxiredoxin family protein
VIICYSGDLEKTWAALILATTAAASGVSTKIFLTFWGLQTFVRDDRRITGRNWMQRMLSFMERPGIRHRKLSKLNFLGLGPWMMGSLARQHGVASPVELLDMAVGLGVELMPCQMTMDMFGLRREDMIDGLGEPVGAATVVELFANGAAPLFI